LRRVHGKIVYEVMEEKELKTIIDARLTD